MSKLYTEEQMKLFYELGKFDGIIGKEYNIDEEIKKLTPIELPTDEEIEDYADEFSLKYSKLGITEEEVSAFVAGMRCMRNKIQGGNQ